MKRKLGKIFFQPFFSLLLRQKSLCLVLLLIAGILFLLQILKITVWVCPFFKITGLDCPGCGMTRAAAALFYGDIRRSLQLHPFASLFIAGWLLLLLAIIIPEKFNKRIIAQLENLEKKTGIVLLFLLFFLLFGVVRLIYEIYILI